MLNQVRFFKIIFLTFFLIIFIPAHSAQMPNLNNLSGKELADLEALEKELAQAAQEIDRYVASLPPEEQAQFHQAVKEVEGMIENMSEEEFNQMMSQMFQGTPPEQVITQPEPIVVPPVEQEVKVEKPLLTVEQERKQETAVELIESLIKYTNSFVIKTQSIPEIPGSVERWALQGKIDAWPTNTTWQQYAQQLNILNQKFYTLLDKDTKTDMYRYILELVQDEKTFNMLRALQKTLAEHEKNIDTPGFGLKKMNPKAKDALQKVISSYSTVLYSNNMIATLEALIEKYNPTAKKLKEEETKAADRAKKESAAPRAMGRTVLGGRPDEINNNGAYPAGNDYGIAGPGMGSFSGGNTPGGNNETPFDQKQDSKSKDSDVTSKGSGTSTVKDKKDKAGISDATADRLLGQIEESFKGIQQFFEDQPLLKNVRAHLLDNAQNLDPVMSSYSISALEKKIANTFNQIKNLEKQINNFSSTVKEYYKKEISSLYNNYRNTIEQLARELQSIQEEWNALSTRVDRYKKYAYFKEGELPAQEAEQAQPSEIKNEESVQENREDISTNAALQEEIATYEKNLQEYETKKNAINISMPVPEEFTTSEVQRKEIREARRKAFIELEQEYAPLLAKKPVINKVQPVTPPLENEPAIAQDVTVPPLAQEKITQSSKSLFDLLTSINRLRNAISSFAVENNNKK